MMTAIMETTGSTATVTNTATHVATIMTAMTIMIAMRPADGTGLTIRICRPALPGAITYLRAWNAN